MKGDPESNREWCSYQIILRECQKLTLESRNPSSKPKTWWSQASRWDPCTLKKIRKMRPTSDSQKQILASYLAWLGLERVEASPAVLPRLEAGPEVEGAAKFLILTTGWQDDLSESTGYWWRMSPISTGCNALFKDLEHWNISIDLSRPLPYFFQSSEILDQ